MHLKPMANSTCVVIETGDMETGDLALWAPEGISSIMQLGREAGRPNGFQAYLLKNQTFDHVFFREFWGFNEHRLDRALWISENSTSGVCVGIQSDTAYFIHSNKGNPCTDMMLAFGDMGAGGSAKATGTVWRRKGVARDLMMSIG